MHIISNNTNNPINSATVVVPLCTYENILRIVKKFAHGHGATMWKS